MATCRDCRATFKWAKVSGHWRPLGPDGELHRCPPKPGAPITAKGHNIAGRDYHPTCLGCPGLPWEQCCGRSLATAERMNAEADERWNNLLDLWGQP